jgi:hypothetical protein
VHPDRNVPANLDNLPGRPAALLDCSKLVNDALVLSREGGDYTHDLPEGRRLSKVFKIYPVGDNERQQDVAVIFSRRYPQGASCRLNYVDATLLRVGEHDAVDGWYINAFCQTPRVGHKGSRLILELAQEVRALSGRLLA